MKEIMGYEEFKDVITSGITEHLPDDFPDYTVQVGSVRKTNEIKEAMSLIPKGAHMAAAPNIYLDDAYEAYKSGKGIEELFGDMVSSIVAAKPFENNFSPEMIRKDRLILNLINRKLNEEMLKDMPHTDFLDLAVIYRIVVSSDENGFSTIPVNHILMEEMGRTQEEIHRTAYENSIKLHPLEVVKLNNRLYMATNASKIFGAAMILYKETMEAMKERTGGSFYVIPSSVHETMIVPARDADPEHLLTALKEANERYVRKQEWLSDNLYFYDAEKDGISIYEKKPGKGEETE